MNIVNRVKVWGMSVATVAALAACGITPVDPGQQVSLQANEGIAAVVMDSLDVLSQVSVESADGKGKTLSITQVPKGISLYVFVVPAGKYCFTSFHFGEYSFHPTDMNDRVCFDVTAGKIAYSGNVGPRAYGKDNIRTDRYNKQGDFEQMLKRQYPQLADKYQIVTGW